MLIAMSNENRKKVPTFEIHRSCVHSFIFIFGDEKIGRKQNQKRFK